MEGPEKNTNNSSLTHGNDETLLTILQQQQRIVENYINTRDMKRVDHDANFEEKSWKNITDRDAAYTGLLKHYIFITKIRNFIKEFHKWIYFWIIMILMICFGCHVFDLLKAVDLSQSNSVENLVMTITVLISFSSVVISIPLIITKYLFSSEEDKSIADIILHTQDHDSSGRQWALDFKRNIPRAGAKSSDSDDNLRRDSIVKPPV